MYYLFEGRDIVGVVEETRQVIQDFLAPELRELRGEMASLVQRMDSMEEANRARFEKIEETTRVRFDKFEETTRAHFDKIDARFENFEEMSRARFEKVDARLESIEEMSRVRFEILVQRLDQVQQSFAFDKRISDLEADKRRSA
ncbi:MAG: hypothetical protein ACRD3N_01575 [Terracidiphilus sp.]